MTGDVAVVGASTSGLLAAWSLARAGRDVTIYERSGEISPAARTLIVTSAIDHYLKPFGRNSVVNHISGFELFTDGRVATVPLEQPDLVVERSILINELIGAAVAEGARLELGARFEKLERSDDGIAITLQRGENSKVTRTVRNLIGADGAHSRVADSAGLCRPQTAPLVQAIVDLPKDLSPHISRVWFRPQDTPYFYWLVPHDSTRGALGLIGEDGGRTRAKLDSFLAEHDLTALEYQAAQVPIYTRWCRVHQKVGDGHVYLVGDAAGQVKVSTVGGLVTGFRGAFGVVDAIQGKQAGRRLRSLRLELALHLCIRKALHDFEQEDYSRLLDLLNDATRKSLGKHNRDEAAKVLWQCARVQPRLMLNSLARALGPGSFPASRSLETKS